MKTHARKAQALEESPPLSPWDELFVVKPEDKTQLVRKDAQGSHEVVLDLNTQVVFENEQIRYFPPASHLGGVVMKARFGWVRNIEGGSDTGIGFLVEGVIVPLSRVVPGQKLRVSVKR